MDTKLMGEIALAVVRTTYEEGITINQEFRSSLIEIGERFGIPKADMLEFGRTIAREAVDHMFGDEDPDADEANKGKMKAYAVVVHEIDPEEDEETSDQPEQPPVPAPAEPTRTEVYSAETIAAPPPEPVVSEPEARIETPVASVPPEPIKAGDDPGSTEIYEPRPASPGSFGILLAEQPAHLAHSAPTTPAPPSSQLLTETESPPGDITTALSQAAAGAHVTQWSPPSMSGSIMQCECCAAVEQPTGPVAQSEEAVCSTLPAPAPEPESTPRTVIPGPKDPE